MKFKDVNRMIEGSFQWEDQISRIYYGFAMKHEKGRYPASIEQKLIAPE